MKKNVIIWSICLLAIGIQSVFAQKIKRTDGDASELSSVKRMNTVYVYEDVTVGKFTEKDYLDKKTDEFNKKEAGRGDKWRESWESDKIKRFPPNFNELFEKNSSITVGDFPKEKYTMTIRTTRIEPGFNVGVWRKNAEIDADVIITETATKRVVVAYNMLRAPGRSFGGFDYDTGFRIEEAFAKAGKEMGQYIAKEIK